MLFSQNEFKEKTIIITGASSGIGKATAILLNSLGANIILISRNEDKLNDVLKELKGDYNCIFPYDLANLEGINNLIKDIVSRVGKIDGLVHSAGIELTSPFNLISIEKARSLFDINFFAFFELVKAISKKGNFSSPCNIVAVSSASGLAAPPGLSIYSATKAALNNLVMSLSAELAKKGIRINTVSPSFVKTDMFENMKRFLTEEQISNYENAHLLGLGEPIDVANAIAFFMSDVSKWVSGTTLLMDGASIM